jgi:SAM-dependent methyltransferase
MMMPVMVLLGVVTGGAVVAQNQRVTSEQNSRATPSTGTLVAQADEGRSEIKAVELDVPYVPTPPAVVNKMLELADVKKEDIVYDLGCGDGRIVITAAKRYGVSGVGVDIDPQRIKESKENARKEGVENRVQFLQQDLFKTDISKASVLTLYLLPNINLRLRPQIFRQVKPGTRISSHAFSMGDWEADQTVQVAGEYPRTVYFWVVPAHVGGTWRGGRAAHDLAVEPKISAGEWHLE